MNSLIRTKQGSFSLENAQELEDDYNLLKITDVLNVKTYNLNDAEYQKVINGNSLVLKSNEELLLLLYNNDEIAIYNKDNNKFNCNVMLKINTQDK